LRNKHNLVLYIDKELVAKSKSLGFNLSKTFENHLKNLITQYSTFNSANNFNSRKNRIEMMELPGFEPGSIEPKAPLKINWSEYKQYLFSKYAKSYAVQLFEYSRKHDSLLNDVNSILLSKSTIRNNVINSLTALSRFLGTYDSFMAKMKAHGIKRVRPDRYKLSPESSTVKRIMDLASGTKKQWRFSKRMNSSILGLCS